MQSGKNITVSVVDNKNVGQSCGNPVSMAIHIGHVTCLMFVLNDIITASL